MFINSIFKSLISGFHSVRLLCFSKVIPLASAFLLLAHAASQSEAVDPRFGFVGGGGGAFAGKFGLTYYSLEGNYNSEKGTVFSSVDPAQDPGSGFKVVREVAKLNVRQDGLGETYAQFQSKLVQFTKDLASWYLMPSWGRGKKPVFKWYAPNAMALIHAESLQIVETIRREKLRNPQITGTVWEIGNEPNFFPAILPTEYAAIFTHYSRVIKGEDPNAVIAMGSIFMPEINQDLKVRFAEELEIKIKVELQAAGLYKTMVAQGIFPNLVADIKNTILSRTLALSTPEYLRQVLDATLARPEIVTVHVYPYDDRAPKLDSVALKEILDSTVIGISTVMASKGISDTWGDRGSIWITEFGNIEQNLPEPQVALHLQQLLDCFQGNVLFGQWFYYKPIGLDEQFALFSEGPSPLTRLAKESNFVPMDENFSCAHLNELGNLYWRASHGGRKCQDTVLNMLDSLPTVISTSNSVTIKDTIPVVQVIPRLPPVILNEEGSLISPILPLRWSFDSIPGLDKSTAFSRVEFFRDSGDTEAWFRSDSITAVTLSVTLPGQPTSVWPRVKMQDAQNFETPWSAWKKLKWVGSPTTRILAGPAVGFSTKLVTQNRSFRILRITLPEEAKVRVQILDSRGLPRRTLFQGHLKAGQHAFPYDGRGEQGRLLPGGIYFCRFQANEEFRTIPASILP